MFALRLIFLSMVLTAIANGASADGSLPTPPAPPPFYSGSPCSAADPKVVVAYEISEDCRVLNLRTIIDDRTFEAQDTSLFFKEKRVFAYIDQIRIPLRDRTIDLVGERYDGQQLRCRVDSMNSVISAWIEEESPVYAVHRERNDVELMNGHLPDLGTLSEKGEVQGACYH